MPRGPRAVQIKLFATLDTRQSRFRRRVLGTGTGPALARAGIAWPGGVARIIIRRSLGSNGRRQQMLRVIRLVVARSGYRNCRLGGGPFL